jgi:cbb3-type cytochrome oxidase subunit 3
VAAILMLTPLAVLIAFGGSCAATHAFVNTSIFSEDYGMVFVVAFLIFLIPPAVVLIGMIWWAVRTHSRAKADAAKERHGELAGDSLNALAHPGAADEQKNRD